MNGSKFHISDHPLVAMKLTRLRREEDRNLSPEQRLSCGAYSQLMKEISTLLAYEATRDLPTDKQEFETTRGRAAGSAPRHDTPVIVPILRSGLVMAQAFLDVLPYAHTGHIGIHRDKSDPERKTIEYLVILPDPDPPERLYLLLDPVVAEGDTVCRAIESLKQIGVRRIRLVSLIVSSKGRDLLAKKHPDVEVYCAAVDERVNPRGEVEPGLGSVSEHLFGFKALDNP